MSKISIIIPIYNVEKYLSQCLESAVNQTFKDIEIICINDCSTDSSLQILEEFASKDSRIKIINNPQNVGWSTSERKGLAAAGGKYIMFIDSDDWLEPNACETAYNQIEKTKDDLVYFGFKFYYETDDNYKIDETRLKPFKTKFKEGESFSYKDLNAPFMHYGEIWYKIYSHDFLKKNNITMPYGLWFAGDLPFNAKIITHANTISYINTPLYNYRMRSDKSNSIYNTMNYKNLIKDRKLAYEIVNTKNDDYFMKWYLVAHINSYIGYFDKWTQINPKIHNDFYRLIHNDFKMLQKKHNIEEIKEYIKYEKFLNFANIDISQIILKEIIANTFSVKNDKDGVHKTITILGLRIKIKKHQS
ncbi:glycosyltransferase family 2 protein [bacterium]|nr:glycosyltransferase family 2 protein [bacterium]